MTYRTDTCEFENAATIALHQASVRQHERDLRWQAALAEAERAVAEFNAAVQPAGLVVGHGNRGDLDLSAARHEVTLRMECDGLDWSYSIVTLTWNDGAWKVTYGEPAPTLREILLAQMARPGFGDALARMRWEARPDGPIQRRRANIRLWLTLAVGAALTGVGILLDLYVHC